MIAIRNRAAVHLYVSITPQYFLSVQCPLKLDRTPIKRVKYKRCSACLASTYCSRKCQNNDWKLGHRDACKVWRLPETLKTHGQPITYQDERFIKYLVRREIISRRVRLCREAVLRKSPSIVLARFDYREWPMKFTIAHLSSTTKIHDCGTDCPAQSRLRLAKQEVIPRRQIVVQILLRPHSDCDGRWIYIEDLHMDQFD
ncbi:mynd domain [Moniliophthora roreri]|nr:mynd domain [Moniliophthora roreri]